jgi:hypothetical protein
VGDVQCSRYAELPTGEMIDQSPDDSGDIQPLHVPEARLWKALNCHLLREREFVGNVSAPGRSAGSQ